MTRDAGRLFGPVAGTVDSGVCGLDIRDDDARLTLEFPGVKDEDLEVLLEDNTLRIHATRGDAQEESEDVVLRERTFGEFDREYSLPWPVQDDGIDARLERGVLTLTLKRAPEAAPRAITVKSA
jgi:HSP20 family protein